MIVGMSSMKDEIIYGFYAVLITIYKSSLPVENPIVCSSILLYASAPHLYLHRFLLLFTYRMECLSNIFLIFFSPKAAVRYSE